MDRLIKYFQRGLIIGILIIISITLALAFVDILYEIKQKILSSPKYIIDANGLMDMFSLILVLLIGLELLETVKAYLKEDIVHVEFIILVAIIAIARKVIVWDFEKYSTEELLSLAAMIVGLATAYFLIKISDKKLRIKRNENKFPEKPD